MAGLNIIRMNKIPAMGETCFINASFNGISLQNLVVDKPLPQTCILGGAEDYKEAAVVVINAKKSFTHRKKVKAVLDNFCMTVKQGTIYTLIGASGCGKTVLLESIVAMKRLDSGSILIFGAKTGTAASGVPGKRIGYMPQELSLYKDFTIYETLTYFGSLYGMKSKEIEESRNVLMNLLRLPEDSRRVSILSGGQKRRVSLAVSLVHSPSLLILDEPTVGIDPLLRNKIWDHLRKLVSDGKTTVIITTHYIEESKASDRLGVMRGGRLLTEKSPKELFEEFKLKSLEEVVVKLCYRDEEDSFGCSQSGNIKVTNRTYSIPINKRNSLDFHSNTGFYRQKTTCQAVKGSLVRIKSLIMKNAFVMSRNIFLMLFVVLLPATQTIIMSMSMGNDPKPIKVGVVNYDYNYTGGCNLEGIRSIGECNVENLSCSFLTSLPFDTIQLFNYHNKEEARDDIRLGKIKSFITFVQGYSEALYERSISGVTVDNATLYNSMLLIEMDASNAVLTKTFYKIVFDSYKTFVQNMLRDCGYNPEFGGLPIKFENPIYGKYNLELREYVAAGMLIGVALFFPLCSTSITYIWDKKQGTMDRARVAGTQTWEIMMSYFATEGVVLCMQTLFSFLILIFIFKISIVGSTFLAVLLVLLNGFAGISLGLLIASICTEEIQAILMGLAIMFPNFFLAGSIWPIEGMPIVLQYLSYALPGSLANEAFRSIVVRGWGFTHFYVWTGFLSTFCWLCFYWILGIFVHKVTLRKR